MKTRSSLVSNSSTSSYIICGIPLGEGGIDAVLSKFPDRKAEYESLKASIEDDWNNDAEIGFICKLFNISDTDKEELDYIQMEYTDEVILGSRVVSIDNYLEEFDIEDVSKKCKEYLEIFQRYPELEKSLGKAQTYTMPGDC